MSKTKEKPVCKTCGSDEVMADAWAAWDVDTQQWELQSTYDSKYCENCEGECKVKWVPVGTEEDEDD